MVTTEADEFRNTIASMMVALAMLAELQVTHILVTACPECLTANFTDAVHGSFLCGYCGYGPYNASDFEAATLQLAAVPQVRIEPMNGPDGTERTGA